MIRSVIARVRGSATGRVMGLTALGMLVSLLADVLVAARLGTGTRTDALIVALTLPLAIDTIVRQATNFSLVPVLLSSRDEQTPDAHRRFVSALLNGGLLLGLVVAILLVLASPALARLIAPGLPESASAEAAALLRLCGPMAFFTFGIAMLAVVHNSERRFTLVALRNLAAPTAVVLALAIGWSSERVTEWIAGAYTVGLATFFLVLYAGARRATGRHRWSALARREDLRRVGSALTFPTLTFAVRQAGQIVERTIASLVGEGGVASYYFAHRIFSAIQTVVGVSAATTLLPRITELGLRGQKDALAAALRHRLLRVALITVPIVIAILLAREDFVQLIFGRGAFDADSVAEVSGALLWLGLSTTFFCAVPVMHSALHAQRRYELVFLNALLVTATGLPLAWLLSRHYGVSGIAMGISLSLLISALSLLGLLRYTGIHVMKRSD